MTDWHPVASPQEVEADDDLGENAALVHGPLDGGEVRLNDALNALWIAVTADSDLLVAWTREKPTAPEGCFLAGAYIVAPELGRGFRFMMWHRAADIA